MKNIKSTPLFSQYAKQTSEQIFTALNTSLAGLSTHEVHTRQKEVGLNQIEKHSVTWLTILKRQFTSPFIYVFFIIIAIYLVLGEYTNTIIIASIIAINIILGFYQEYRAENNLKLLKKYLISSVLTRRDGQENKVLNNLLVPGDIIIVYPGDIIPADCRFIQAENLMIDESTLTGESRLVSKTAASQEQSPTNPFEANNIGFAGTTITSGKAIAVVFAIGINTALGHIAYLATETMSESNLNKGTMRLARFIFSLILITLVITIVLNVLLKGKDLPLTELFIFSIALAITAMPEALPIVITFCLSQGASLLAQQKVIVKRLSAIEDLGSIEVLCTDKTGTLTENTLAIVNIFADNPRDTLFYAANMLIQQNKKNNQNKDFDNALWQSLTPEEQEKSLTFKQVKEIPFDHALKKNITLLQKNETYFLIVRGQPEEIKKQVNLTKEKSALLEQWIINEEEKGNRVVAVAKKELSTIEDTSTSTLSAYQGLEFLGLISFADPIKKTAFVAVKKAQDLGLKLKILSGDSSYVCASVALQLGIITNKNEVITGTEFDKKTPKERAHCAHSYSVFARVTPEQKYEIINYLQKKYSVGYLGDGINDAPALKTANVSMVVQDAAPIARETADIILLKKNLLVIVSGIEEGRKIFINTLKYVNISIAMNFGNFFSLAIASLLIDYLPMLPIQLLAVNILSDFPMIAIATDNVSHNDIARIKKYNIKDIALIAIIIGGVSSFFDFTIFAIFSKHLPATLQTSWFIASILTELACIFSLRKKDLFFKPSFPSLPLILLAIITGIITIGLPFTSFGQNILQLIPLSMHNLLIIGAVVTAYFITTELVKLFYYRNNNDNNHKKVKDLPNVLNKK